MATIRVGEAARSLAEAHDQLNQAVLDLRSISYLKVVEDRAGLERARIIDEEASYLLAMEASLQREYAQLI